MGTAKIDGPARETYETGNEPEFIAHDLERWEDAGDGLVRIFVSSRRGNADRVEYTVVCTPARLVAMCMKGLMFAAELGVQGIADLPLHWH